VFELKQIARVPHPHLIFFLPKIIRDIYIKINVEYEFKKIKKLEPSFLDREDFTDNDT
jgi:hypothetical protein